MKNKKNYKILGVLVCVLLVVITFITGINLNKNKKELSIAYIDNGKYLEGIDKDRYYYNALLWAYEEGILIPSDGIAKDFIGNTINRADTIRLMYRYDKFSEEFASPLALDENFFTHYEFTDLTGKFQNYASDITWAINNGITNGTTKTTFSPNDNVTRKQFVTFLWRYAGKPEVESTIAFTDVNNNKAIDWGVKNGITKGYHNEKNDTYYFDPNGTCKWYEAIVFLYRYDASKKNIDLKTSEVLFNSEKRKSDDLLNYRYGGRQEYVYYLLQADKLSLNSINRQKYNTILKVFNKYTLTESEKQLIPELLASQGCYYISTSNAFINYIIKRQNSSEDFSKRFGYDLYVKDNQTNEISYNVEALALDLFIYRYKNTPNDIRNKVQEETGQYFSYSIQTTEEIDVKVYNDGIYYYYWQNKFIKDYNITNQILETIAKNNGYNIYPNAIDIIDNSIYNLTAYSKGFKVTDFITENLTASQVYEVNKKTKEHKQNFADKEYIKDFFNANKVDIKIKYMNISNPNIYNGIFEKIKDNLDVNGGLIINGENMYLQKYGTEFINDFNNISTGQNTNTFDILGTNGHSVMITGTDGKGNIVVSTNGYKYYVVPNSTMGYLGLVRMDFALK